MNVVSALLSGQGRVVRRARARQTGIECLESRLLLTVGTSVVSKVSGTALTIDGTHKADNVTIKWLNNDPATKKLVVATVGQKAVRLDSSPVKQIRVSSYRGNDRITNLTAIPLTAFGGSGNDILFGGSGNDRLSGDGGSDTLTGGRGNDVYLFGPASAAETDVVNEAASGGFDTLSFGSLTTAVKVSLASTAKQNVHKNRSLRLTSGAAIDKVVGGSGNDRLIGNALANTLVGGRGSDVLSGGKRNDTYVFDPAPRAENDVVNEPTSGGIDTLSFASLKSGVTIKLGSTAKQTVHTNRTLQLSSGATLEKVSGGSGNDRITGNAAANTLLGKGGKDTIYGGSGKDNIRGGMGDDNLYGGDGDDKINGDKGFDAVYGGKGMDAIIGEKVDGNTLPFLPVLQDVDVPRKNSGVSVSLPSKDSDGDVISYKVVSSDPLVKVSLKSGGLWIKNSRTFLGVSEITVTASDGRGLRTTRSFSVSARNQLPTIETVDNVRRLQGSGSFRVPFRVADADGDQITRTFASSRAAVKLRLVKLSSGAYELRARPADSFTGRATISMFAGDGIGEKVVQKFTLDVSPSTAVQSLQAAIPDFTFFVRLDDSGNVWYWRNRVTDVSASLIAENTKSLAQGMDGKIFRLGLDGSLNRRDPDGTWTAYAQAAPNIARLHAAAGDLFLIPADGGTLGVLNPETGDINASLIAKTVQNEIADGNLHTLDSSGNLYINGVLHLGPPVYSGSVFLYFAALGRVRELTVAHDSAYYVTSDRALYRVLDASTSERKTDYTGVLRIRGLDKTLYIVQRGGYQTYWEDGLLGGGGASIGLRQRFASDSLAGYTLENGKLYRIPAGVDENPVYIRDNVADIIGHAGLLYLLNLDGSLYRRSLNGGYKSLGTGVRRIYEVGHRLFVFRQNGQLETLEAGELQPIATGVRQFSHSGDFYAGQPWVLYEDGRIAEVGMSTLALTVLGGSPNNPYNAIAVGDGTLLAIRKAVGVVEKWNGSAFVETYRPYSWLGKALELVEADGIAAALYEGKAITEWRNNGWILAWTNYSPTEAVIGVEFEQLAADQDRVFAQDADGDIWTIPLLREGSKDYGRGDWLWVQKPLNTYNRVYQVIEAGGRIYARQNGTVFEFSDVRDYTDTGDWKVVGGKDFSTGSPYYWDLASAGGNLYVRDDYQNARILQYSGTPGSWIDVSGTYRFNDISTSTEGNLVGLLYPDNAPIAYLGDSWEETTLLWRRGRVLTISGRNSKDDYLKLAIDGNDIVATVNDPNGQQVYRSAGDSSTLKSFRFLKSEIDRVVFHGLGGNDTVDLDASWNSFVPILGYGGAGEDTFKGRVGFDQFYGGSGRDTITWELDLTDYLNGGANAINTQADMVGDHIIVDVRLGQAVRVAFEEMQRFISDRLRPVTDFLNSDLVYIKEFNFRITWRQAISKLRGLKELVRFHDELLALSNVLSSLPIRNGLLRIGEFDINGSNFSSVAGTAASPFTGLNDTESIRTIRSYGINLPFLLDGRELVKIVVGLPVELVTIDTKLSTWLTPSQLDDAGLKKSTQGIEPKKAISLASGIITLGPVPVQWELKFNYGFDLGLSAGLDTRGIISGGLSSLREGLYLRSFSLKGYGKLIGEAGWDAGQIADALPNLSFIELVAPRAELVGEIGVAQTYTYSNGGKTYLFGPNQVTPTLTVDTTLFGALRIEAELGIRAKGWLSDYLDDAEQILESAADAYFTVYEDILNLIGTIVGQKAKRVRRPEVEIKKEVNWEFMVLIADFDRTQSRVFRI